MEIRIFQVNMKDLSSGSILTFLVGGRHSTKIYSY